MSWSEEAVALFSFGLTGAVFVNEIRDVVTIGLKDKKEMPLCVLRFVSLFLVFSLGVGFYMINPSNYQESTRGISGTTVNIEGLTLTQVSHGTTNKLKVWDSLDIAEPPAEYTEFFITTKRVKTGPQNIGDCIKSNKTCSDDSECAPDVLFEDYSGVSTGTCVNGTCSVLAWCPPEYDEDHTNAHREYLNGSLNFFVLIQSHTYIQFSDGYSRNYRNTVQNPARPDGHCVFNNDDRNCPYFKLEDIVRNITKGNQVAYDEMLDKGAVIAIQLYWKCDVENDIDCSPTYNFTRLDGSGKGYIGKGFSYTNSEYLYSNRSRTHVRSTGIHFIVLLEVTGYRTSWEKFILMSVAILGFTKSSRSVAELILIYWFCKKKEEETNGEGDNTEQVTMQPSILKVIEPDVKIIPQLRTQSTQQKFQTLQPERETTQPESQTTQPERETTEPESQTTQPERETAEPESQTTQPDIQTAQPGSQTTQPDIQTTQPESQTTQPESQTTQPESQPAQPESQPAQPESRPTQIDSETAQPENQMTQPENQPTQTERQKVQPESQQTQAESQTIQRKSQTAPSDNQQN